MKYAVQMGLVAMIYILSFIQICFLRSKVNKEDSQTGRMMISSLLVFFSK
jgi:hypothetical protein